MATNHLNPHIFHPPRAVESVACAYETAFWRQESYALRSQCLCRAFCPSTVFYLHPGCPQPSLWPGLDVAHYHGYAHGFFRFLQRNPAGRACASSSYRGRNSGTRGSGGNKGKAAKKSNKTGTCRKTRNGGEKKRPHTSTERNARACTACNAFNTYNACNIFDACNTFSTCRPFTTCNTFDACKPTHKHNPACSRRPGHGISYTFAPPPAQHAVSVAHYGDQQKYCCG